MFREISAAIDDGSDEYLFATDSVYRTPRRHNAFAVVGDLLLAKFRYDATALSEGGQFFSLCTQSLQHRIEILWVVPPDIAREFTQICCRRI